MDPGALGVVGVNVMGIVLELEDLKEDTGSVTV